MRLIDADVLLDSIFKSCNTTEATINNAPTIDAVPVVRCWECMYRQKAKVNRKGFLICPASGMEITDDDFCSYGERKEDRK